MLSLLRTKYFQFMEHGRQEGFLSACKITLYKYEEMVPTVKDLATLRPLLPILDLGPENFYSQALDYPLRSRRERTENYFRRGYRVFVMVQDGRVVGDLWYVTRQTAKTQSIHPHVVWFGLDLADDEVYVFDLQVNIDQRGGGLTTHFHGRILEILRERGFRKAYGCFVAANIPALWMHRLIGYRELPRCIVRRFFLYEVARPKPESECRLRRQPGKRALDLLLVVPVCVLLLPLLALIAILVRTFIGSPVLFRQERPGLHAEPFPLLKFRTMTNARDETGRLLPDGARLTALGRFLRQTSLDELPELFNVLRGDLSLVGPRPLLMKYLPYFSERESLRHAVLPGITGYAQINGRNHLPWDQRLSLDVWYAENWSLGLDLYILAVTLWKVLRREGVAPDTYAVEPDLDLERRERYGDA